MKKRISVLQTALAAVASLSTCVAHAQEEQPLLDGEEAMDLAFASDVPAPASDVPTLERVKAQPPEEEVLDLYRPIGRSVVEPNRFDRFYNPGPSPEEVALERGGYINYGINLGLEKSWRTIKKVTGMREDFQPATARPPPLSDEQMRRAASMCGVEGNACPAGN